MLIGLRRLILGHLLLAVCLPLGAFAQMRLPKPVPQPVQPLKLDWTQTAFFHWGGAEANAVLLSLGGYDFRGRAHSDDLGDGRGADFNSAVASQLAKWYATSRMDAAGGGFYISPIPLDTSSYGPDLLIAEIVDAPKEFAIPASAGAVLKAGYDQAQTTGKIDALPWITSYTPSHWSVVSRAPRAGEPRLRFRPPGPGDVERAFQSIHQQIIVPNPYILGGPKQGGTLTQSQIDFQYFFAMKQLASMLRDSTKTESEEPMTRSSDIFLRRLFFDRMDQALRTEYLPRAIARKDSHALLSVISLLAIYRQIIPDDPRTHALEEFVRTSRSWLPPAKLVWLIKHDGVTDDGIATAAGLFEPAWTNQFLDDLMSRPADAKQPLVLANFLYRLKRLNPLLFDDSRTKQLDDQLSHILSTPAKPDVLLVPDLLVAAAERAIGGNDPQARVWLLGALRSIGANEHPFGFSMNSSLSNLARLEKDLFPLLFASPARSEYLAAVVDMTLGFFNSFLPVNPSVRASDASQANFRQMLEFWKRLRAMDPASFREVAARIERRMGNLKEARRWLDTGGHLLWRGFALGISSKGDLKTMIELSTDLPTLRALVVDRLLFDYHSSVLVPDDLAAKQVAFIERQKDLLARERPKLAAVVDQATVARTSQILNVLLDPAIATKAISPAGLPRPQADLAKIFPLVDPIFVSVKIRQGLVSPHLAFNFPYRADDKKFTQPAWENFVETWNFLAVVLPTLPVKDGAATLARADAMLLDGYVDRTISLEGGNWDRSKYKTLIHGDDWTKWDVESHRADFEKFFHIDRSGSDFVLTFKTATELGLGTALGGQTQADVILAEIVRQVETVKDPIAKSARVLHLMTKMHPNENGNGRLGRLWASVILLEAGYACPAGLPAQDFLLSEERLAWEIRRSIVAGKFFEKLLAKSVRTKVSSTHFFRDLYLGSPEEGVVSITTVKFDELKVMVREMESWSTPPEWTRTLAENLGKAVLEQEKAGRPILQADEMVRADLLVAATMSARPSSASMLRQGLGAATEQSEGIGRSRCEAVFAR